MRTTRVMAAAALAAGSGLAGAGPLETSHVPGTARWVAHVDLQAAGATEIGRFMLDMAARESDNYAEIRQGLPGFTLDPEGGLHGITIFGRSLEDDGEDFVALVYGDERIESWGSAIDRAMREHGFDAPKVEADGHRVWIIPADGEDEPMYAALARSGGERVWVVTRSATRAGKGVSFIGSGGREHADLASLGWKDGTIAFAALENPGEIDDFEEMSHVVGEARRVIARVGEAEGRVFMDARLDTDDEAKAQNLARMADGLLAMGTMMSAKDEELARVMEIARSVRIEARGGSIRLSVSHEVDEVKRWVDSSVTVNAHSDWEEAPDDDADDHEADDFWGDGD